MKSLKFYLIILVINIVSNTAESQTNSNFDFLLQGEKIENDSITKYDILSLIYGFRQDVVLGDIRLDMDNIEKYLKLKHTFINNDTINLFNDYEERLILLALGNYREFLADIDSNYIMSEKKSKIIYKDIQKDKRFYLDSLTQTLLTSIITNKDKKLKEIDISSLNIQQKEFIDLCLSHYTSMFDICNRENKAEYQDKKEKFKEKYPNTFETKFVKQYMTMNNYSNLGIGYYINSGLIFPTNNLSNYFTAGIPITWGLYFSLNKVFLTAGFGGSIRSDIKQNFDYQLTWNKGDKVTYAQGELLFGYKVMSNYRFNITPYIGFGGIGFAPYSQTDSEYYVESENLIGNSLRYGVDFQLKWGYKKPCSQNLYLNGISKVDKYFISTLSLGYNSPKLQNKIDGFEGSLWFITFRFGYMNEMKNRKFRKQNWL